MGQNYQTLGLSTILPEEEDQFKKEHPSVEAYCLSRDPYRKIIDKVHCLPWQEGLKEIGL